ncbi:unnamed protein product [Cyclocybe aegerita]|uniref:Uncharacterized protein n=1 Tax=Cyclocybe aegerita TaxID=1973307 RepID=A0A8S0VZH8_CYCAE|nr:unnamed protein product [Cyclocybe aegerita]
MRTIDDAGEDFWEDILARARQRERSSLVMETFNNQEDMRLQENDMIFEIGCLVGHEESVAFKVLSLVTHPTFPQTLACSIVAQSTIPGRIYAEVDNMTQARALARRIPELNMNNIRPVSLDERTDMLTRSSPYRLEDQKWVQVHDKRAKWKKYLGDTGLLIKRLDSFLVGLIPRIGKEPRPPQALTPQDDMVETFGIHKVKALETQTQYIFQQRTYTRDGILRTACNAQDALEAATSTAHQATGALNPGSAPRQAAGTPRPGAASAPHNTAALRPVAAPRPVAVSKPAAISEPATISKPVTAPRPVAASEPATISKPVTAPRPVAASKPAPIPKPVAASSTLTPLPPDNAPNSVPTSDWLKAPEEACFDEIYVQTPPFATITNRTRPSALKVTEKVQATSEAMATPPIDRATEPDGPGAMKTKSASGKGKSLRNAAPPPAMRTTCSHAAQKRKSDDSQELSRPPAKKQCMDIQRCPHAGCVSIPTDGLTQKLKRTLDKLVNSANLTLEYRDKLNVQVHDELRVAVANMAQELDWPMNVDFKSLPDYLCYLWLSLVESLQKVGANAEDLSHWEDKRLYNMMCANLHASYYRPMSMKIIEDWFVKTYPQDTMEPKIAHIMADVILEKMIRPLEAWWTGMQGWTLTYCQFLDLVAIPGIANILIEDDTGLTPFEVEKLCQDSYSYGVMFHRVTAIHDALRTGEPLRLSRKKLTDTTFSSVMVGPGPDQSSK